MKFFPVSILILLVTACRDEAKPAAATPVITDTAIMAKTVGNPLAAVDISPVDISYFPVDYPVQKMSGTADASPVVRVIYSRPHRQGRRIFGELIKYGEPWRLGANEATEIEIFQPVTIQGRKVAKGRYILYCIPQAAEWTVVFNSNVYSWGLKTDTQNDVYRFPIPAQTAASPIEYFTLVFEKTDGGADLIMAWDNAMARLPLSF